MEKHGQPWSNLTKSRLTKIGVRALKDGGKIILPALQETQIWRSPSLVSYSHDALGGEEEDVEREQQSQVPDEEDDENDEEEDEEEVEEEEEEEENEDEDEDGGASLNNSSYFFSSITIRTRLSVVPMFFSVVGYRLRSTCLTCLDFPSFCLTVRRSELDLPEQAGEDIRRIRIAFPVFRAAMRTTRTRSFSYS